MADTSVNIPVSRVMHKITMQVNVTGMKTWRVRMWLGVQTMKLAALIMGCNIEVKT
jgi:hypothetical protein